MHMYNWLDEQVYAREKMMFPILSYPAVQLLFVTVKELVTSPGQMALGMRLIADRYKMPAALSYMDLSVEAEAFGATCVYQADEVPTIIGRLVSTEEEIDALKVPSVGAGRTGTNVTAIRMATRLIHDRPIIANCIGPFSLAGRLMNVNDILLKTLEEPELVHKVLRKATDFIHEYIAALKGAGANGVILAEPLAGLLSPALMQEFSSDYVREIVDEHQDRSFLIIYHNCAGGTERLVEPMLSTNCRAFHFGEKADIEQLLKTMPEKYLIMGNLSAASVFKHGTPQQVRMDTQRLLLKCMNYKNFMISSGCDIPADTDLDCVDAFFETAQAGYYKRMLWDTIS